MPSRRRQHNSARLPPFDDESGTLNAVVETIAGSRNKFAYDEKLGLFRLKGVLPAGASFPFDFGFVPSTKGEDGDPLDVLVLMDEPAFAGCLVPARLLGVTPATLYRYHRVACPWLGRRKLTVRKKQFVGSRTRKLYVRWFFSERELKDAVFTVGAACDDVERYLGKQ